MLCQTGVNNLLHLTVLHPNLRSLPFTGTTVVQVTQFIQLPSDENTEKLFTRNLFTENKRERQHSTKMAQTARHLIACFQFVKKVRVEKKTRLFETIITSDRQINHFSMQTSLVYSDICDDSHFTGISETPSPKYAHPSCASIMNNKPIVI